MLEKSDFEFDTTHLSMAKISMAIEKQKIKMRKHISKKSIESMEKLAIALMKASDRSYLQYRIWAIGLYAAIAEKKEKLGIEE
jgi:hypothetical protein